MLSPPSLSPLQSLSLPSRSPYTQRSAPNRISIGMNPYIRSLVQTYLQGLYSIAIHLLSLEARLLAQTSRRPFGLGRHQWRFTLFLCGMIGVCLGLKGLKAKDSEWLKCREDEGSCRERRLCRNLFGFRKGLVETESQAEKILLSRGHPWYLRRLERVGSLCLGRPIWGHEIAW